MKLFLFKNDLPRTFICTVEKTKINIKYFNLSLRRKWSFGDSWNGVYDKRTKFVIHWPLNMGMEPAVWPDGLIIFQYLAYYCCCPNTYCENCQNRFKMLPNINQASKILPNTDINLPKWRNFAKSGHTVTTISFYIKMGHWLFKTVKS